MRVVRWVLAALALAGALGAGCGKVKPGTSADGGVGSGGADGAAGQPADAGAETFASVPCLDRSTELPRPPTGTLPCEMLAPTVGK
jgi:hypothetical protein